MVLIVSEKPAPSCGCVGGMLKRHLAPQTLQRLLTNELAPAEEEGKGKKVRLPGRWFKGKAGKDESNEK